MKTSIMTGAPNTARGVGICGAIAAIAGLAVAQAASAQTVFDWIGPVNGAYNNAANWNPIGIPDALGEAFLLNGGSANMTSASTVDRFDLEGGSLSIANAVLFSVATQIPNGTNLTGIGGGGTININSSASTTGMRLVSGVAGDKFIWANTVPGVTSIINMGPATTNVITGGVTGLLLVNQAVIRGAGQVGVNVLNIENASGDPNAPALIESSQVGLTLTIDPAAGGVLNDGILRSSAGVLRLTGGTFTQTTDGAVELAGTDVNARVDIVGATIIGGTLRQTAFGVGNFIDTTTNAVLESVSMQGARVRVPNAQSTSIVGEIVLDATSTISLNSTASTTALQVATGETSATLSGAGTLLMSNATSNQIRANTTGQGLINNLGGGIVGSGQVGTNTLVVTNNTLIEANGTAGLTIDPPTVGGFVNTGTLKAASASTLTLTSGTFTNTDGLITANGAGAVVVGSGISIIGGDISSANGGEVRLQSASSLQDVDIATGSLVRVPNVATLNLAGTITNNGTISLDSSASTTTLSTSLGDVTIDGTGQIVATNAASNVITAGSTGQRLTLNNVGGFAGSGQIGANSLVVTNNTTIAAEGATGLRIDPPTVNGFENDGTVRANAGSLLTILAGPFDNTEGVIQVLPGGAATLSNASITGGTLQGAANGIFTTFGTTTLTDVTIVPNTTIDIANGTQVNLAGTIELDGVIAVSATNSFTDLRTTGGDVVINGDGQITMSNGANNSVRANVSGQRFTFNNAGGVRGSGQLGVDTLAITNNTTIASFGSAGLRIDPVGVGGFDNNGVVLSETDSNLTLLAGPFENASGVIRLQPNSTVSLQGASITGGRLEGAAGASFVVTQTSTLSGVTIDSAALLRINNLQTADIANGLVNNGDIRIDAASGNTSLRVNGNQTLSGPGSITLVAASSRLVAQVANQRLINQGNTIQGTGQIGADTLGLTNRGRLLANVTGGITIDPPAGAPFLNDVGGVVHASAANIIVNPGGFTNTGGTVLIDATRKLDRTNTDPYTQTAGVTIANGEVEIDSNIFNLQGGTLAGSGAATNNGWVDSNVNNTGGVVSPGASAASGIGLLTIEGTFTQSGNGELLIEIGGPTPSQYDRLVSTGAATLGGTLRVRLLPGYDMMIGDAFDVVVGSSRVAEFNAIIVENLPFLLQFNVELQSDRVRLVAAERCLGDYDLDGGITGGDIAAFFADFEQGSPSADLDQDGGITGGDIAEFFSRFENGC